SVNPDPPRPFKPALSEPLAPAQRRWARWSYWGEGSHKSTPKGKGCHLARQTRVPLIGSSSRSLRAISSPPPDLGLSPPIELVSAHRFLGSVSMNNLLSESFELSRGEPSRDRDIELGLQQTMNTAEQGLEKFFKQVEEIEKQIEKLSKLSANLQVCISTLDFSRLYISMLLKNPQPIGTLKLYLAYCW
ncbi:hypothetical protein B296_00018315, partial [Ensete ventricosum]